MKMRMRFGFIGILGLAFMIPAITNATVVQKVELTQLVEHSAIIFHGIVRRVDDDLSTSCRGPFLTRLELEVVHSWKGHSKPTLELTLPGGRACSFRMKIPGMPQFESGQEVILFLEKTSKGYVLTGLHQGVYWVDGLSAESKMVRAHESAKPQSLSLFNLELTKLTRGEQ